MATSTPRPDAVPPTVRAARPVQTTADDTASVQASQPLLRHDPVRQAYVVLRTVFVVAPVAFGLDKFTNWLVEWDQYLAPLLSDPLPIGPHQVMYAVGVVEVAAGVLVAVHARLGALVIAGWLTGIIINLLLIPGFYDVALRDVGLLLSAVALQRLASRYDPRPLDWPLRRGSPGRTAFAHRRGQPARGAGRDARCSVAPHFGHVAACRR